MHFKLTSPFKPAGGQEQAISKLTSGYSKHPMQTLLGITGSGKSFVFANVIQNIQKPTLVIAHNKTLASQLYQELKSFFPKNKVEYFVSYYDYYQPESYIAETDTYIEKDASINEKIEEMRLKAITSLISRKDTIVVASVSCIYGVGSPSHYKNMCVTLSKGEKTTRDKIIRELVSMQYSRSDKSLERGKFRVKGDTIEIIPSYDSETTIRIELFEDEIEKITELESLNRTPISTPESVSVYPATNFAMPEQIIQSAIEKIERELYETLPELPLLEKTRLKKRTLYDISMIRDLGYCTGIENYSRHFDNRLPGTPPSTLINYFPEDFLLIIDESHQTIPQLNAMYKGDYSRKRSLIENGFRLKSAFDNRPLKFSEFESHMNHVIFVSATPSQYELSRSKEIVELIIRPTGLLDPVIEVRPTHRQIDNLIEEVRERVKKNERVLVTTITKKMAENLSEYLASRDCRVRYLHSDISTTERTEIIRELRLGEFDVLVGINLLREGLDIPEVSLVCILDADKESFLRDERSLIQTVGRAARNENGQVIMYADSVSGSMRRAIDITRRRRELQREYNKKHNITPKTIIKPIPDKKVVVKSTAHIPKSEIPKMIKKLEKEMNKSAKDLDFETAIDLRERIKELKKKIDS